MDNDARMAAGLARNPADGMTAVYTAYSAKLYTYALTMLRDPAAAQDVVHDALLVAAGSIGQLRDPEKLRPWLYAITRNECLRALRARNRFSDADEVVDVPDDTVDLEAGLRREEASRLVALGMTAMNPADRDILSLALQHDLDVERVSQITGTPPNAVHARLSRARSGLSDAVSALMLYRTRGRHCEELATIIHPGDQPLTPLVRKRIQRHVKSCDACERRRRSALAALGPAMAAPMYVSPPAELRNRLQESLQRGQANQLSSRAEPFDDAGFPVPLDRQRRSRWLLAGAAAGATLLVMAVLVTTLFPRGQTVGESGQQQAPLSGSVIATPSASEVSATPEASSLSAQPAPAQSSPEPQAQDDSEPPTAAVPAPAAPRSDATRSNTTDKADPTQRKPPSTSKESQNSPTPAATMSVAPPPPPPAAAPQAPTIANATVTDLDVSGDGSFSRCDAFTLRIRATVTGDVDAVVATVSGSDTTVALTGDPRQATTTLPPGEYTVEVEASGPGGRTTRQAGSVLHICPG